MGEPSQTDSLGTTTAGGFGSQASGWGRAGNRSGANDFHDDGWSMPGNERGTDERLMTNNGFDADIIGELMAVIRRLEEELARSNERETRLNTRLERLEKIMGGGNTGQTGPTGPQKRSYAAAVKSNPTRAIRVAAGRQEVVIATQEKDMNRRSAAELLQATRSVWGEKAILRARPLTHGRTALTITPGAADKVMAQENLAKAFGPTAKIMKGGLRVIAKGVPGDILEMLTLADLGEWKAFHLTTRRGYGSGGTAVFSVPTFEIGQRLVADGLRLGPHQCSVESFDPKIRVKQCFRCWRWGHIGTQCQQTPLCGGCGKPSHMATACPPPSCTNCRAQGHGPRALELCPVARKIIGEGRTAYRQRPLRFTRPATTQAPAPSVETSAAATAPLPTQNAQSSVNTENEPAAPVTEEEEDVFLDASAAVAVVVVDSDSEGEGEDVEEGNDVEEEDDDDEDIDMDRLDEEIAEAEAQYQASVVNGKTDPRRAEALAAAVARRNAANKKRSQAVAAKAKGRTTRRSTRTKVPTEKAQPAARKAGINKTAAKPARRL